jgi:hypothetical protein
VSYGTIFLFVESHTFSKATSASFQVTQKLEKTSIKIKWLSVQFETILNQFFSNSKAKYLAFKITCFA